MTVHSVVPTLRHHTPENRLFERFLAASCESRAGAEALTLEHAYKATA